MELDKYIALPNHYILYGIAEIDVETLFSRPSIWKLLNGHELYHQYL